MDTRKTLESTQEQATASWINYLNQVHLDRLMEALTKEQENLDLALGAIRETLTTIHRDIVDNGLGRGGTSGMHGFIAEVAECGIGNAREQIEGRFPIYEWINDNGPDDLRRGTDFIQQKFVQAGNHLSLQAVRKHLQHYPDYLSTGHKYQIPSDHYAKIKWLLSISEEEANKMPTSTGEFSLRQWREVHDFFNTGDIPLDKLEPSILEYDEVQRNTFEQTLSNEAKQLKARNKSRREQAYLKSKPSVQEAAKATAVSAAAEGCMALCLGIAGKRRHGKHIREFDQDDWKDLAGSTGIGTIKGGVRGSSIYLLTNYTATPAAVASALVTAAFGIAEQVHQLRQGNVNEQAFIENSEILCLDATVSALSSFAGQIMIPVPILGAVLGNAVGSTMYQLTKQYLSSKEETILEEYLASIDQLSKELALQYQDFILGITEDLRIFMDILDRAFSPDIRLAFTGSVELAKRMGVPAEEIIDSRQKMLEYFLN